MATLVFTALGTAIGGPLGGALGSLVGSQLDRAIIGGGRREGPRLKELAVTTSSYGTPIPRHFGTMRAAGTIIWATDLVETNEKSSGGKGSPSTRTYSYSASFAVALASRPIARLGRIWADGNLLRGAAGDLKVGGRLRVYKGYGDQPADPLLASDHGELCPAFRGRAYCVFEGLQLADFGNRIPALTFEIIADDGAVTLGHLAGPAVPGASGDEALDGLIGLSDEGGPLAGLLDTVAQLYPLACDAGGPVLAVRAEEDQADDLFPLPPVAVDESDEHAAGARGPVRKRQAAIGDVPHAVRYYDPARDYQASVQRAGGRAPTGRGRTVEFPGALAAEIARKLIETCAQRAAGARETLSWRTAELDPLLAPGKLVTVPGHPGRWRIERWEWRDNGVELGLRKMPLRVPSAAPADPGSALPKSDLLAGPTELVAVELPWSGQGAGDARQVVAAVSSPAAGWTGAALYCADGGALVPIGIAAARRSAIGRSLGPLGASPAMLYEPEASIDITLISADLVLPGASLEQLSQGANRAVLGTELLQFVTATRIAGADWRLTGLLRGRGGTESAALAGHPAGTPFALIDEAVTTLGPDTLGRGDPLTLAALGVADEVPVMTALLNPGATTRPLAPVHPHSERTAESGVVLTWTRRARGAWGWPDGVDVPLNEDAERYVVGLGDPAAPLLRWETGEPRLELSAAAADLVASHPGVPLWVCQIGRFAMSDPLRLDIPA